ncbi:MAG: methyltransferase domain-containing protein, partial [Terriglobia bacterium]
RLAHHERAGTMDGADATGAALNEQPSQASTLLRQQLIKLDASCASNFDLLSKATTAAHEKLAKLDKELDEVRPQIAAIKVHAQSFPQALRAIRRSDANIEEFLENLEIRLREIESRVAPDRAKTENPALETLKKKRAAQRETSRLLEPFGGSSGTFKIAPYVSVISDIEMREARRDSLNRLCNLVDWQPGGELSEVMKNLNEPHTIHRKAWEYALCVYGLEKLGAVKENSHALAVGAGYERPLYYFANRVERMVATDLYNNPGGEGKPEMLTQPENFAPFAYRKDHLEVLQMSGEDLKFPDNHFDFVFCLSSIEHFGSREKQQKSLEEMRRVVKAGGIIAITTELILNQATHPEYFTFPELEKMFLRYKGLNLVGGELDLRIGKSLIEYPVMMENTKHPAVSPHIVLYAAGVLWTSVMMFLQKSRQPKGK